MKNEPFTSVWHDFMKESPENSGKYLVVFNGRQYTSLEYSKRHNAFNASDREQDCKYAIRVDYWANIPPLPQEVTTSG